MNPESPPSNRELNFVARTGDPVHASSVGLFGLIGFAFGLWIAFYLHLPPVMSALLLLVLTASPMVLVELFVNRVYRRESSGLDTHVGQTSFHRLLRKYVGLLVTFGALAFVYWLFPEYGKPTYAPVWSLAVYLVPATLILAIPYFAWVDARQAEPEDAYFKIGAAVIGEKPVWAPEEFRNYLLGWGVKGFFLPIMLSFLGTNIGKLLTAGFSFETFPDFYLSLINLIFTLDVTFGAIGYLLTCRALDSHIRKPEFTAFGWFFTLICYPPFLSVISKSYYSLKEEQTWQDILISTPYIYVTWGFIIIVLLGVYVWATVCFGCRFSNLTNRGIITYGPYRFMKHPAYFFKCLAWWFLMTPFFSSPDLVVKGGLLLALKCGIYFARAKAEERLLSEDPAYVLYSDWIAQFGVVAGIRRMFRNLLSVLRGPDNSKGDAPLA